MIIIHSFPPGATDSMDNPITLCELLKDYRRFTRKRPMKNDTDYAEFVAY